MQFVHIKIFGALLTTFILLVNISFEKEQRQLNSTYLSYEIVGDELHSPYLPKRKTLDQNNL